MPSTLDPMRRHLDLLRRLYLLSGLLSLVVALSLGSLAVGALGLLGHRSEEGADLAAGLVAMLFSGAAALLLAWAAANVWVARSLDRPSPSIRYAAAMLAVVDLFVPPFGTALGAYGLWVLFHEETQALFGLERGA